MFVHVYTKFYISHLGVNQNMVIMYVWEKKKKRWIYSRNGKGKSKSWATFTNSHTKPTLSRRLDCLTSTDPFCPKFFYNSKFKVISKTRAPLQTHENKKMLIINLINHPNLLHNFPHMASWAPKVCLDFTGEYTQLYYSTCSLHIFDR